MTVVVTASPHLAAPARKAGRRLLTLGAIGTILNQHTTPTGALAAVLVAAASAAVVHLVFGSSVGRPGLADVADVLARLGIGAHSLRIAERQTVGVFLVDAIDDSGQPMIVKVYGRDAHDTQLVTTIWRTAWYREAGSPTSFGRLQQAEHEAFLTLLAGQAGIPTHSVVTATATPEHDVVLALRRRGQPLSEAPEQWDDAVVAGAWQTLADLHRIGVAHGQVDDQHLILEGHAVGLVDFHGGVVAPTPERLRTDRAHLLVTTALAIGTQRAATAAATALGSDELGAVLPFVQLTALTTRHRRMVRAAGLDLDAIRSQAAASAGVPVPELQQLRRVSLRSVLTTGLLVLAFFAIVTAASELDWDELVDSIANATWWLVVVGAVLAQTPRVSSAVSVMGASPVPLPLGPVVRPTARHVLHRVGRTDECGPDRGEHPVLPAARAARRCRPRGRRTRQCGPVHRPGRAADRHPGPDPDLVDLQLDGSVPSGLRTVVIIVAGLAAASVLVLALVAKWRRPIVAWVRQAVTEAVHALRGLRSPRRLAMLFGGALATEFLFALALQTFARGLGFQVGIAEVIVINVSTSLLSSVLPIPGGIGVVEGGLTLGLVRAGMPEESAFAAVLLYRIASFYLPPVWGFFALRWLERYKYL